MRGRLTAIGELFRAGSGLVAILALLAFVAGATRLVESADRLPVVAPAAGGAQAAEPAEQAQITSPSRLAEQETMVFYLVATGEQEYNADWGENVGESDHWRHYRILYARNDTELQAAQQAVIDYMLSWPSTVSVRLIDARIW
jgi:hypothetical protein